MVYKTLNITIHSFTSITSAFLLGLVLGVLLEYWDPTKDGLLLIPPRPLPLPLPLGLLVTAALFLGRPRRESKPETYKFYTEDNLNVECMVKY